MQIHTKYTKQIQLFYYPWDPVHTSGWTSGGSLRKSKRRKLFLYLFVIIIIHEIRECEWNKKPCLFQHMQFYRHFTKQLMSLTEQFSLPENESFKFSYFTFVAIYSEFFLMELTRRHSTNVGIIDYSTFAFSHGKWLQHVETSITANFAE